MVTPGLPDEPSPAGCCCCVLFVVAVGDGVRTALACVEGRGEGRRFIKPLRYDAPRAEAFANALLLDVGQRALPLHLVSPYMDERSRTAKRRAIELAQHDAWVWETDRPLPTLPKPARPAG